MLSRGVLVVVLVASFFLLLAAVEASPYAAFASWMRRHEKSYSTEEFRTRFHVWTANSRFIDEHNKKENITYTLGMNEFGDLAHEEFSRLYKGFKFNYEERMAQRRARNQTREERVVDVRALPSSWDWRSHGAVTAIKNQGQCGGCWSFSATGAMEGVHKISTDRLVGLSEQNLLDCTTSYGNDGCNGGAMQYAFEYVIRNGGIDTESSYPYQCSGPLKCRYTAAHRGATIASYSEVPSGSESDLQAAVHSRPVSVGIDASLSSFQFYKSGVYYEPSCSAKDIDHGVLAIGWGVSGRSDYWLVKNSWGTSWGIDGYVWMARNRDNNCGIASDASYPIA